MSVKSRHRVQTRTTEPLWAFCQGCPLHWYGPGSARQLTDHVATSGHEGVTISSARVWREPVPEPAALTPAAARM